MSPPGRLYLVHFSFTKNKMTEAGKLMKEMITDILSLKGSITSHIVTLGTRLSIQQTFGRFSEAIAPPLQAPRLVVPASVDG